MFRRFYFSLVVVLAFVCLSCDSVPLLAPTNSSVTIDAQSRVVPTGGTTEVTATVIESSGTPVHNGTLVRFTTTLGRMDPVEAQTRNGMATTTFIAGEDSGIAEVRATSGAAGGSTTTPPSTSTPPGTTTPTTSNSNVVQIAVGAGAVDTVTVRANPSSVSTTGGGTVTVTATVLGTGGRLLSGIPVNFTVNRGTLSSTSAVTNGQGQAQVTLTTNGETTITVVAGTKKETATVTGRPGPSVVLTCSVTGASTCATATLGQTIVFTAAREAGSANADVGATRLRRQLEPESWHAEQLDQRSACVFAGRDLHCTAHWDRCQRRELDLDSSDTGQRCHGHGDRLSNLGDHSQRDSHRIGTCDTVPVELGRFDQHHDHERDSATHVCGVRYIHNNGNGDSAIWRDRHRQHNDRRAVTTSGRPCDPSKPRPIGDTPWPPCWWPWAS